MDEKDQNLPADIEAETQEQLSKENIDIATKNEIEPLGKDENLLPTEESSPTEIHSDGENVVGDMPEEPAETSEESDSNAEDDDATAEETHLATEEQTEASALNVAESTAKTEEPTASAPKSGILISKPLLAVFSIGFSLLLAGGIFFGIWIGKDRFDPWEIDPNAKDYESIHTNNSSSESISIPGYADVVLPSGQKNVQMVLLNPQGNPCYFRFTLTLKESGEQIYVSGLVPPGQAITDLRLSRPLEKGKYTMCVVIECFSLDESHTPMNGANVETDLTVQ